jgi:hypothetical protein
VDVVVEEMDQVTAAVVVANRTGSNVRVCGGGGRITQEIRKRATSLPLTRIS